MIIATQLKLAMGKMDKNKDGKISKSEYLQLKAKFSSDGWNVKQDYNDIFCGLWLAKW